MIPIADLVRDRDKRLKSHDFSDKRDCPRLMSIPGSGGGTRRDQSSGLFQPLPHFRTGIRPNLERNIFSGLTPAEVELIEERDLFQYYNEKLQGKKLMFHELVKGVLDYLLSVRKHELSSSGFAFESQSLEGPSPLLGWGE